MSTKYVITVGREFCSGGAEIAKILAEHYGIPYYDKAIIDKAAEELNYTKDIIEDHEECPVGFFDISGYQYGTAWYLDDPSLLLPIGIRVADAQFKVIGELADKGPCVIVGRCSDYVLRYRKDLVNIFVKAPLEARITRAMRLYDIDERKAKKLIKRTDKIRASYYNNYTNVKWGDDHYDLVVETDGVNTKEVAEKIIDFIDAKN